MADTSLSSDETPPFAPGWLTGVDLGGTKIEAAVLDPSGALRARLRRPTPRAYEAVVAEVAALVAEAEARAGAAAPRVGVGGPGSVSPRTGLMRNANSTALNGRALPEDLAAALGRPVIYANDADCLAASEAADGAGAGAQVVFAAILGTGVGGGLALNGRAWNGVNRMAGEWGHTPL
ncbi:MAG TPA: ROK family protein, partial [Caulobacteraceae bacterium]